MPNGDPALIAFISDRMRSGGPVTFRWFMEQALYHPEHGYYASGRAAIGRRGDYFTNVSVGPLFGKLMAAQFREMWERMGRPERFTLVEQGANNGDFARDVLAAVGAEAPDFAAALHYVIVEPFPVLGERQKQTLSAFLAVEWRATLDDLEPFRGVHFSNELVDAMPVHLVKFHEGAWKERFVDWSGGAFAWSDGKISCPELAKALEALPLPCIEGYTTEINLAATGWIASLSSRLEAGHALIVDYGWPRDVYYNADRVTGTLACYSEHKRSFDPLENAGAVDITAHVDFTTLAEGAVTAGFQVAGFADQHHFMVGLGKNEFPDTDETASPEKRKALRAFQTLMHPGMMGLAFKFLGLEKNVFPLTNTPLAGFQFAADAWKHLRAG